MPKPKTVLFKITTSISFLFGFCGKLSEFWTILFNILIFKKSLSLKNSVSAFLKNHIGLKVYIS